MHALATLDCCGKSHRTLWQLNDTVNCMGRHQCTSCKNWISSSHHLAGARSHMCCCQDTDNYECHIDAIICLEALQTQILFSTATHWKQQQCRCASTSFAAMETSDGAHLSLVASRLVNWLCREVIWSSFCLSAVRSFSTSPVPPSSLLC